MLDRSQLHQISRNLILSLSSHKVCPQAQHEQSQFGYNTLLEIVKLQDPPFGKNAYCRILFRHFELLAEVEGEFVGQISMCFPVPVFLQFMMSRFVLFLRKHNFPRKKTPVARRVLNKKQMIEKMN